MATEKKREPMELNAETLLHLIHPHSKVDTYGMLVKIRDRWKRGESTSFEELAKECFPQAQHPKIQLSQHLQKLQDVGLVVVRNTGIVELTYDAFRRELLKLDRSMKNLCEKE